MTNEERILEIQRTLNDENIELSTDEELELLEELSTLNNISINEINNTNQINNTNEMTITQNTNDILFIEDYTPEQLKELQTIETPKELPIVESNLDIVKRVLNEIYPDSHDILDVSEHKTYCNRLSLASTTKYQIAINFKDVTISNSRGEKTIIDSIYIFFFLDVNCKLLTYLFGYRDITNINHAASSYAHSHICGFNILTENLTNDRFCLGANNSAISVPVHNCLADAFSENNFRSLLVTLIGFVSWESLEGTPYIYIRKIINLNNTNISNNSGFTLQSFLQLPIENQYNYRIGNSNLNIVNTSAHNTSINEYFYSRQSIKIIYKHILHYINNILKVPLRFTTNNINGVLNVTLNLNITDIDNIFASEDFYTSLPGVSNFKEYKNNDDSINIELLLVDLYTVTNSPISQTHLTFDKFKYLFCTKLNDTYYSINNNDSSNNRNSIRSIEDKINNHQKNPSKYSLLLSTGWKPILLKEHLENTSKTEESTIDYSKLTLHPSISYVLIDMLNKHFTKFLIKKQNESSK